MNAPVLAVVALGVMLTAFAALGARAELARRARMQARLALVRPPGAPAGRAAPASPLRRIGDWLSATPIVGSAEAARLKQNLYAAGFVGGQAVDRFVGLKIMLGGLFVMLALLWLQLGADRPLAVSVLLMLGAALAGLRGPDVALASRAKRRRELMDRGLPDALDMLVTCGEAGIGLETSLERVAIELRQVHPELAAELTVTVSEMRLLPDRLQALHNMGERVRLDSVRAIASTLSQTLRYGTPLGKALRTLTADFRLQRQMRMEERAARLPVLITVPMIVFILPATTLVVAGPAFLQLIDALGQIGGNG